MSLSHLIGAQAQRLLLQVFILRALIVHRRFFHFLNILEERCLSLVPLAALFEGLTHIESDVLLRGHL